jgi:DNA-directed RNA polymerase subunit RPC12/RpoP
MRKCGICGKCETEVLLYKRSELGDRLKGILELCNISYVCVDCRNTLTSTRIHDRIRQMVKELEREDRVRAERRAI